MYKEIDSYELNDILKDQDINLIDLRDKYIYSSGTIKNAKNIPSNYLLMDADSYLDKNKTYYFFCSHGNNSRYVCDFLSKRGFHVVNIIDGYQGYLDSIL